MADEMLKQTLLGLREHLGRKEPVRVPLGAVRATPGASQIDASRTLSCLCLHEIGDWGACPSEDHEVNEQALARGMTRVMSAWAIDPEKPSRGYGHNTFWIITQLHGTYGEPETTLLLPEEY
jgi:hypothetical protein